MDPREISLGEVVAPGIVFLFGISPLCTFSACSYHLLNRSNMVIETLPVFAGRRQRAPSIFAIREAARKSLLADLRAKKVEADQLNRNRKHQAVRKLEPER